MKRYLLLSLGIICLSVISAFTPTGRLATTEWKLAKDKDNIKVFTRQSEGSKIKEFKAIITVTATMQALVTLIENVNSYPNWQANIATAKILRQINETTQYIYYTTDVPWPVTNRDAVIYSEKVTSANGIIIYNLLSKPDYVEEKKDYIRIKNAKGMWLLTPKENNKIEVTYQFYGDPAGTIPAWLINMFIVDGPYTTMINLKGKVEK